MKSSWTTRLVNIKSNILETLSVSTMWDSFDEWLFKMEFHPVLTKLTVSRSHCIYFPQQYHILFWHNIYYRAYCTDLFMCQVPSSVTLHIAISLLCDQYMNITSHVCIFFPHMTTLQTQTKTLLKMTAFWDIMLPSLTKIGTISWMAAIFILTAVRTWTVSQSHFLLLHGWEYDIYIIHVPLLIFFQLHNAVTLHRKECSDFQTIHFILTMHTQQSPSCGADCHFPPLMTITALTRASH
jgi:hypothetical protein